MGELCPWCGVTMQGDGQDPAYCSGRYACSQRKAFEEGQEAGYLACLDYEARARAIRAVVAAQWGVACVLFDPRGYHPGSINPGNMGGFSSWQEESAEFIADLPTAEQIVDGGGA